MPVWESVSDREYRLLNALGAPVACLRREADRWAAWRWAGRGWAAVPIEAWDIRSARRATMAAVRDLLSGR